MQLEKPQRLFVFLAAFFCVNAVLAEFIGVKIFALETTLGIQPFEWNLFGQTGSLNFTAGTLLWPIVFIMTDIVNEYYGERGVRFISYTAVALILYGFLFAFAAIQLAPASWWVTANQDQGVPDLQKAFAAIFGQGLWTIGGSVVAFLLGQSFVEGLVDQCQCGAHRNRFAFGVEHLGVAGIDRHAGADGGLCQVHRRDVAGL